jgi:hypothetical protein
MCRLVEVAFITAHRWAGNGPGGNHLSLADARQ